MSEWLTIEAPVSAKVGPVTVRLFAPVESYDLDTVGAGWAVGAMCRVKFRIGELTTSKRMTQKYTWCDHLGWPQEKRPADREIDVACDTVLANLVSQINRHGCTVTVDDLDVARESEDGTFALAGSSQSSPPGGIGRV